MMTNKVDHLYVHIPFCKTICAYCDFCHGIYSKENVSKWLKRLKKEFSEIKDESYKTIYIGGGTPTVLDTNELEEVLKLIKPHTNSVLEYTIEVNPETLNEDKVILLKKYGINRVSMGLQSSNDNLLKLMNRHHTFLDVKEKIDLLRKYNISNISLDIMYSIPTQTMDDLKNTINDALSLDVPHISLYSLTIEENTIFDKLGYKPLDEDIEADMYEYIVDTLNSYGYTQYEIANFSKPNFESKHNKAYWDYNDFRGISMSASSKINHIRYDHTKDFNDYINNDDIKVNILNLSNEDEMFENVMMSLRTIYGLDINLFIERYNVDPLNHYKDAIDKNNKDLKIINNHLVCINREILNSILVDFMYYL